ncbi:MULTISPECIES: ABC-2 transporter permease [Bacillus cereus group]|uniref:ABC-2 transporter permease n=2 Tax=Bacillus cereus group TaxID=86661 RepID=A0A2C1E1W1_BACCE|nr:MULTISPECIES: ABC-2 transporter permease [Bacillus cereus group]OFD72951.1 ABC transporter permease [Bacillus mycoides]OFD73093.1 ABC transporter permease [Bacillus mycoides]OFD76165.1 ABC transporter permease [Bacillus mycoides]PGT06074.1 ABC-2 transporter permease [Bacillus cereus]
MRQLIYKDLFFFRVTWLVYFIMPLVFFGLEPDGELLFPLSCLLITISSSMILIAMDEKNKSDVIINSLPVRRKDIIIARYISSAIFIVGGMLSTMLVVFLIRGITVIGDIGVYHPNLYIEIPWYGVVRGAIYSLVYITALFPSYYGTKSKIVRGIFSGGAAGIGVITGMFIGDGESTTVSFIDWIMNPSHLGVFIVGGMILASVYIASMFLTIKIYGARDL